MVEARQEVDGPFGFAAAGLTIRPGALGDAAMGSVPPPRAVVGPQGATPCFACYFSGWSFSPGKAGGYQSRRRLVGGASSGAIGHLGVFQDRKVRPPTPM